MKNLTLLNDNTNIKLNDTGTVIQFKVSNEGQPVGVSNGQSATFRIKNEFGFLKSVQANTTYGGYVFELDTEDLTGLVPDTYQVELLIQVDSDNALIFPDKGFVQFTINANALNITGEQLPVMSLEDFKDELKTYVTNQTTQATSNIKNDFDTYVDNLTDSTVATATKASQDATTAITKANNALNQRIGARNLLLDSEKHQSSNWMVQYNPNHENNGTFLNSNIYKINSAWNGLKYDVTDLINRGLLVIGETYTFSVYVKIDSGVDISNSIYFYNADNTFTSGTVDLSKINSDTFVQISTTVTCNSNVVPASGKKQFGFETNKALSGYVYFAAPKFEKGDKATDYTPAPEDTETNINSLQSNQSTLLTQVATAQSTADTANNKAIANASLITSLNTLFSKYVGTYGLPGGTDFNNLPLGIYSLNGWGGLDPYNNVPSFVNNRAWYIVACFYNNYAQYQFILPDWGDIYYRIIKPDGTVKSDWKKFAFNTI